MSAWLFRVSEISAVWLADVDAAKLVRKRIAKHYQRGFHHHEDADLVPGVGSRLDFETEVA